MPAHKPWLFCKTLLLGKCIAEEREMTGSDLKYNFGGYVSPAAP